MILTGLTTTYPLVGPGPDADPVDLAAAAIADLTAYAAAHQLQLDPDSIRVDRMRWDAPADRWHIELHAHTDDRTVPWGWPSSSIHSMPRPRNRHPAPALV